MKKVLSVSLVLLFCTALSSCGCAYRWVEVIGHYYKPKHYEQYNSQYYSYGRWVEEQKILRVQCACGTKDIYVEEEFWNKVENGDSVYWDKSHHTVSMKRKSW